MHAIQLHATPAQDRSFPHTVGLYTTTTLKAEDTALDEALAVVLQAVRQSKNPQAMDALGILLAYMEGLEKKQNLLNGPEGSVNLVSPLTMSF